VSKYANILETVGNTPVVRINKLAPPHVNLYVKVEAFNPLGSVKDRLALGVIEDAERTGQLKPGQTVIEAKKRNDFSTKTLFRYRQRLEDSFVLRDLKKYRDVPKFFSSNPHFFTTYPEAMNELAYTWHIVDDELKADRIKRMKAMLFKRRSKLGLLKDAYQLWRLFS